MTGEFSPPLTPESTARIRATWADLQDAREAASQLFVERLAELVPELEPAVVTPTARSEAIDALERIIERLDDPDATAEGAARLGRLARAAGLEAAHHTLITAALLWTLEEGLGEPLPGETRRAWASLCASIAGRPPHSDHQQP